MRRSQFNRPGDKRRFTQIHSARRQGGDSHGVRCLTDKNAIFRRLEAKPENKTAAAHLGLGEEIGLAPSPASCYRAESPTRTSGLMDSAGGSTEGGIM